VTELLTPRDVIRLLDVHGLAPRKSDGQNFVIDPNTVRRIVAAAALDPGDTVLEIGPGLGSLTLGLATEVAQVVAVEIDAGFIAALDEVVGELDNVVVHHADALRADLGALVGGSPVRLVANLPYNIATPLLFHALGHACVRDAFVMVQREVGQRWCATVGDDAYGAVSLKLALAVEPRITLSIPRAVFHPVPNVDSVMVQVRRRADAPDPADLARLAALADTAFTQRRKTLRNNLKRLTDADSLDRAAASAGIDLGARAETLDRERLLLLDAALQDVAGR
jgi:16S rRNA (adenine1518-N6/adenine1519-N6)-dimethyltransferase